MTSNRKVRAHLRRWARYQGRCDKAAHQVTDVPGYGRAVTSWYRIHKRKMQGLSSGRAQRREGL